MKAAKFPEIGKGTGISTFKLELQVILHSHTDLTKKWGQKDQDPHHQALAHLHVLG